MSEVWVLQHVAPEGPAAIGDALARRGIGMKTIRIDRREPVPDSIALASGLVVMGGPMGVYETDHYRHLGDELRLIEDALSKNVPVLGVCLGSQLLAAALGARVYPSGRKEIGWHEVRLLESARRDLLWSGVDDAFSGFHWHGDIFDLPRGATPLARSAMTELQSFSYGSATGLLFHLEVGAAEIRTMTKTFARELRAAKIPPRPILDGIRQHAADLERLGARVFDRWAATVD